MQILKEKFENEKEFRKEEMELKKKEQENKAASSASNADRPAEAEPATVPRCKTVKLR